MTLLEALFNFLIGLAVNGATAAIQEIMQQKFKKALENEESLRKALISGRSLREEVRLACVELARNRARLEVSPQEDRLWLLLSDDCFQGDLAEWLMTGAIEEGNAVKERLIQSMEKTLAGTSASPQQVKFLKTGYFEAIERAVFSNPILAHWRHQLSLDYLRNQVASLQKKAEEAAGIYSPEKQKAALDQYCEKALQAWDIIDLSNLPEGDIHIVTQKLLLRQLYMPLRLSVEIGRDRGGVDSAFAELEEHRKTRRLWEAGYEDNDEHATPRQKERSSVGERLGIARRMVVLGDPRWREDDYDALDSHGLPAAVSQ